MELTGTAGLRLLAHEARQQVISEIYNGREMTATEAADLCGLTPSAMSYHLRLLVRAGVLVPSSSGEDGRERRYRRAARTLSVAGSGGSRVAMQTTAAIWIDSLRRAAQRATSLPEPHRHGQMATVVLRLTDEQNADLLDRLTRLLYEYTQLSDRNGPQTPEWEHYWAHLPRTDSRMSGNDAAPAATQERVRRGLSPRSAR